MGNKTSHFNNAISEDHNNLLQKIGYVASAGYDNHIPNSLHHHIFDSTTLFPELKEFSKIEITSGIDSEALSFSREAIATLKIVDTGGSFKNVVGKYLVDSEGTIRDVSIAFNNTRSAETGLTHNFNISGSGDNLNFFMVANGYSLNKQFSNLDDDDGSFSFVYNKGEENERPAKITDEAEDITLIYQAGNGEISTVRGPIYHSTESGEGSQINTDGEVHVVSGIVGDGSPPALRIGFEDFPGLGDADFNDVVFDLSVSYLHPSHTTPQIDATPLANITPASGEEEKEDLNGNNPETNNPLGSNTHDVNGLGTQLAQNEGDLNPTYGDVISESDQTDEAISNFINLNNTSNSNITVTPSTQNNFDITLASAHSVDDLELPQHLDAII